MHRLFPPEALGSRRAAVAAEWIERSEVTRSEPYWADGMLIVELLAEPVGVYYDICIANTSDDWYPALMDLQARLGVPLEDIAVCVTEDDIQPGDLEWAPEATAMTCIRLCPKVPA